MATKADQLVALNVQYFTIRNGLKVAMMTCCGNIQILAALKMTPAECQAFCDWYAANFVTAV
jgi:hypothetical protein